MNYRSILIIDDNEPVRVFLRKVLEEAGYSVTEAANGQKGLRQFQQTPSALVITDLLMPNMDGLEVTMALHRESPTVKIIVLSGGSGESDFLDAAKLLGAHRTMKKPVIITELLQAVQEELQEGSPLNEHGPQEKQRST